MRKIAIVYWSGTGNTKMMAQACAEGARETGSEAELIGAGDFAAEKAAEYDGVMLGCPAMGAEVLEENTFEPLFEEMEPFLKDRPVALFGSYGWGGGAWMEAWAERTKKGGAKLFGDGLAVENTPDEAALAACRSLGCGFAGGL